VTGAVVSAGIACLASSEIAIGRLIYANLVSNDVILADQAYGNYVDLVLVKEQGADAIFRKNHLRKTDFRREKKLAIGDHKVVWNKPQQCPNQMTIQELEALPSSFIVREVWRIKRHGWASWAYYCSDNIGGCQTVHCWKFDSFIWTSLVGSRSQFTPIVKQR